MSRERGFTAVELLVTLFVATAFMASSYQLYSTIVKESGDIRSRARAGNIAYAELRRHADTGILVCAPLARSQFPMPADHKLDTPSGFVEVTCRADGLMEVKTEVQYGPIDPADPTNSLGNRPEVKYAILVHL